MDSSDKKSKKKIEFIITGFGAFGNHETNPTSILVENIIKNKKEFEIQELYEIGFCEVVYVAIQDCEEFYKKTLKYIEKKRTENPEIFHIVLHFGLHYGIKSFNLETLGYNCANFSIPDNRGNQCANKQIIEKYALEHYFRSIMPLTLIQKQLVAKGFPAALSNDPGRYICNYIYYLSLYHGIKNDFPSVFVHFPAFEDIKETAQSDFAKALLSSIAHQYKNEKN